MNEGRLDKKLFKKPTFSQEPGCWEIDIVFNLLITGDQYLFCININTRYLVVYQLATRHAEVIAGVIDNLQKNFLVTAIRGDGERGFGGLIQRFPRIKFYLSSSPFTNHNKIVDRVIRTIRDAIGYRALIPHQLKQIIDYYNNTYHSAIDCTPKEMMDNPEFEHQYIRYCIEKLTEVMRRYEAHGLLSYQPGFILQVHTEKDKTPAKFEKRRRYWDRLAEFITYDHGSALVRLLQPIQWTGNQRVHEFQIPLYHTRFIAKNINEVPEFIRRSYKTYTDH
jgi:hypothetical protein